MAGAGVVTTTITTPATRVLSVFAGGRDVTGDVQWDSFVVTDAGVNAKGTANMRVELPISTSTEITDMALLRVVDHNASTGGEVFRGFIRGRVPISEKGGHDYTDIVADDIGGLLDNIWIDVELRPPESMQARLGFLWGKYGGTFLSGDF